MKDYYFYLVTYNGWHTNWPSSTSGYNCMTVNKFYDYLDTFTKNDIKMEMFPL